MSNIQAATLTATGGTVATQGPASRSITNAPVRVYSPTGYNPLYAVWEAAASSNAVDLVLTPASGKPLVNPIFRIFNFTLASLPVIYLNGQRATADSDFFATLDATNRELWLTLNCDIGSALRLRF